MCERGQDMNQGYINKILGKQCPSCGGPTRLKDCAPNSNLGDLCWECLKCDSVYPLESITKGSNELGVQG